AGVDLDLGHIGGVERQIVAGVDGLIGERGDFHGGACIGGGDEQVVADGDGLRGGRSDLHVGGGGGVDQEVAGGVGHGDVLRVAGHEVDLGARVRGGDRDVAGRGGDRLGGGGNDIHGRGGRGIDVDARAGGDALRIAGV